ncbi:MAG: response regulator [Firmicutes bacterium]|nr:response regulator [Bacillota bacterium]
MNYFANKKPVLFLTLVLLPLFFVYLLSILPSSTAQAPKARQGVLDLSGWDFEKNGIVPLDGEWEFYWNQLLTYQDFHNGASFRKSYETVPSMWNYYTIDGASPPGYGYATYRLKIKIAATNPDPLKGLKLTTMSTAYKLMVDDTVVAENGVVGTDAQSFSPEYKPQMTIFKTDANEFEVIVQIANYTYARGGLCYSIYLGNALQTAAWHEKNRQTDIFLLGAISIMALYHAAIFLLQRRYNYRAELYFVLIMLLFAILIAFRGECVILSIFPALSFHWMIFFEYATLYWASAALSLFMYELYPEECSQLVRNILVAISALFALISLLTPISFYTNFTLLIELHLVAVALYYTYVAWIAATRKRTGAALLFSTIIFSIAAFILDALYHWNIYNNKHGVIFPLISFIFIFVQSFILSQRFSASFDKVEALSQKLLSLDKVKDAFLANTSHELRTPLHGMISIIQSILENAADTLQPNHKKNLALIVSSGQRLANLINDILDYEKLKHGDISLHKQAIDIRQVIPAALEVSRYLAFSKPIALNGNLPADLPLIEADENRFTQIIYNLLGNAIKFTEQGSITISAVQNENMVEISVTDTGIGIPPDKLTDIFKSFAQLETSPGGQYGGTGLGLSITKYLVEIHGGSIWAASEPGKGSILTFSMPVSHTQPKTAQPLPILSINPVAHFPLPLLKTPAFFPQNSEFTILLVDDDAANLQSLINIAAAEHYSAIAVASGKEALEVLAQNKTIDLVILDIMLPVMSGYEVCRKLREDYSLFELPVLMMTAQHSAASLLTGFAAGANDFLSKPFDINELKARMKTLLQLKKSVSQTIQAETAFLQAQIKPHFLYNALNTILSFCWTDAEKAGQLLLALSDYLRGSFNFSNMDQFSTLEKELEFVDSYLVIEKARFEEKLSCQYHINVPPGSVMIPTLVIQPLVENAVKHGILPNKEGGNVVISVTRQHSNIVITIHDDGIGIPQDKLDNLLAGQIGKSVGLTNINRRLKRLYGHGLEIVSKVDAGTIVNITIPYERTDL